MARYLIEMGKMNSSMGQTTEGEGIPFPWSEAEVNEFLTADRFSTYAAKLANHRMAVTELYEAVRDAVRVAQDTMGLDRIKAEEWLEDNGYVSHETFLFAYDASNNFVNLTDAMKKVLPAPGELAKTIPARDFENILYAVKGDVYPAYISGGVSGNGKMGLLISTGTAIVAVSVAVLVGITVGWFTSGPIKQLFGIYDDQLEKDLAEARASLEEVRDALKRLRALYAEAVDNDPEAMRAWDEVAETAYNALDRADGALSRAGKSLSLYARMRMWWNEFGDKVILTGGLAGTGYVIYRVATSKKK